MAEAKTYKIKEARNAGEKDNPHGGKLVKWYLDMESGESDVYTQKKPGNDLAAGQELYGRIEEGEYGPRFFAEKQEGAPTGQSGGGNWSDDRERGMNWGLALKLASYRLNALGDHEDPEWSYVEELENLATLIYPTVANGPPSVEERVEGVAKSLAVEPVPNGSVPTISKEVLATAFKEYIAGSENKEEAKAKVDLKLASLGVTSFEDMTDEDARAVHTFLTDG